MDDYYKREGRHSLKAQENIYKGKTSSNQNNSQCHGLTSFCQVLLYLVIYRSNDMGLKYFKKFVKCIEINNLIRFLKFLTNREYLLVWIKEDWKKQYDASFVDRVLVEPLLK
jgi:hypothetical protein